jgi:hypothetical protein
MRQLQCFGVLAIAAVISTSAAAESGGGPIPDAEAKSIVQRLSYGNTDEQSQALQDLAKTIVNRFQTGTSPQTACWETTAASQAGGPPYILTNRCSGSTWGLVRTVINDAKGNPSAGFVYRWSPLGVDNSAEAVLSYGLPGQISK